METVIQTEIQMENLEVAYNMLTALTIPSLHLKGNTFAIIGHNGAGKSTFIKTILQLLQPKVGSLSTICHRGGELFPLDPQQHMAFCPESGAVFADISVEAYVKLWCRIKCKNANYYKEDGKEVLDALSITPLLHRLGRELSKGQKRRVQTAIGFLTSPRLFLFDEPFCGLDVQKTRELKDYIQHQSRETSFLIASHRMEVVERLADTVIVLSRGEVRAAGSPAEVAKQLCQHSIRLKGSTKVQHVLEQLQTLLPEALSSRLGSEIIISGKELTCSQIETLLREHELNESSILLEEVSPTLVDGLNYHLKDVENSDAHQFMEREAAESSCQAP